MRMIARSLLIAAVAAAVVAASSLPALAGPTPEAVRTTFQVKGMHCTGCADAITATLERMEGVRKASVDFKGGEAVAVHAPGRPTAAAMKKAIEDLGYTVASTTSAPYDG